MLGGSKTEGAAPTLRVSGDMLGDKILVGPSHQRRARAIFAKVADGVGPKQVIAVCGPSGSGKSEIASLLGTYFIEAGRPSYVLSCDNYPHRAARDNERERERIFESEGEAGLRAYLGTDKEIDFRRLGRIVSAFKAGDSPLQLRIMDTAENRVADDARPLEAKAIDILLLEGTWSSQVEGVDLRLFLDTDFEQTLAHRKARARDPLTPFGERVLRIEQERLTQNRTQVDWLVDMRGELSRPAAAVTA